MPNPMNDREAALHFERLYVQEHVARTNAEKALVEARNILARAALDTTRVQRDGAEQALLAQTSRIGDVRALVEAYLAPTPLASPPDLATLFVASLRRALRGGELGLRGFPINIIASDNIPRDTVLASNGVTVYEFRLVKEGAELAREADL